MDHNIDVMASAATWTKLNEAPMIEVKTVIKLTEDSFMIVHQFNRGYNTRLYKYHTQENEWSIYFEVFSRAPFIPDAGFVLSADRQKLICFADPVSTIERETESIPKTLRFIRPPEAILMEATEMTCVNLGHHTLIVSKHDFYFFNEEETTFVQRDMADMLQQRSSGHVFKYIASKNMLLLLCALGILRKDIVYNPASNDMTQWDTLVQDMPANVHHSVILSRDERYIILFDDKCQDIHIMDLTVLKWKKSRVKMPFCGISCAKLMGRQNNELLVAGFVRLIVLYEMKMDIPREVANLLLIWYGCDEVHLFEYKTGAHWKIFLDHILFDGTE